MLALLLGTALTTFGVGARVERSLRASARLEQGRLAVRAPVDARVSVRRARRELVVTVQR